MIVPVAPLLTTRRVEQQDLPRLSLKALAPDTQRLHAMPWMQLL
jgi:hypothetical protein